MVFLCLKSAFGDKNGKVNVLNTELLDLGVEEGLDLLPDAVGVGEENVAATNFVVGDEFGLRDQRGVPEYFINGKQCREKK